MAKYTCDICGKTYNNPDDYIACVTSCGYRLQKEEKEKKEKEEKRLLEVNAAINGVKQAKSYYEERLNEFKKTYPKEYELNFAEEGSGYKNVKEYTEPVSDFELSVRKDNDKEPVANAKVNGKDVEETVLDELLQDPFVKYCTRLLGV